MGISKKRWRLASMILALVGLFLVPTIVNAQTKGVLTIKDAWYGLETGAKVSGQDFMNNVRRLLQNGKIVVPANMNSLFGDPAPGRGKVLALYVQYGDGSEAHLRASEGQTFVHGASFGYPNDSVEEILDAWYGLEEGDKTSVKVQIRKNLQNGIIYLPPNMNSLFGDPAPGKLKVTAIYVRHTDGSEAHLRATEGLDFRYGSCIFCN